MSDGRVDAVSSNGVYSFTKPRRGEIVLVPGLGVEGDVHAGVTVRHRSRVRADPSQPNLRQVHLIPGEVLAEVDERGFAVAPGDLGENVTTSGVDLFGLPRGAVLRFGPPATPARPDEPGGPGEPGGQMAGFGSAEEVLAAARRAELTPEAERAVVALEGAMRREPGTDPRPAVVITGLRNPCAQIDGFSSGLLKEVAYRDEAGRFVRKAGVMGVVLHGGAIRPGDEITVEMPPQPFEALDRV